MRKYWDLRMILVDIGILCNQEKHLSRHTQHWIFHHNLCLRYKHDDTDHVQLEIYNY